MKRSSEVEDLLRRVYDALRAGDADAVASCVSESDGVTFIGTDPEEWWVGHQAVVEVFRAQLEEMGGFDLFDERPEGWEESDVAWVADQPALRMPDGADVPLRVSAVARREGGGLRFVQWHASVGALNEEILGRELTI